VDSEVGRLRAVIVHRLGAELKRVVPRGSGQLLAGTKSLYRPGLEPLHGGDLVLAAPGVIAAGCPPPGVERLARGVFDAGSRTPCSWSRSAMRDGAWTPPAPC
jgi:hypothetical protein